MEHVVEIGVFGYVCGEFGDTFATVRRPKTPTIICNTMAKSSSKQS
jgi:hypothetical protein